MTTTVTEHFLSGLSILSTTASAMGSVIIILVSHVRKIRLNVVK